MVGMVMAARVVAVVAAAVAVAARVVAVEVVAAEAKAAADEVGWAAYQAVVRVEVDMVAAVVRVVGVGLHRARQEFE